MKFLCDRCKTRYSIADDRVRGKILKIRCKNCSAVITVREGMQVDAAAAAAGRRPTTGAPEPEAAAELGRALSRSGGATVAMRKPTAGRRPGRGGAGAPVRSPGASGGLGASGGISGAARSPGASGGLGASGGISGAARSPGASGGLGASGGISGARSPGASGGLGASGGISGAARSPGASAAYRAVRSPPPPRRSDGAAPPAPATLDTPWFVSVDGAQTGPLSLEQAKEWVAGQDAGRTLYCWSEGFDGWQPVERVSHFRNLRAASPQGEGAPPAQDTDERTVVQSRAEAGIPDAGDARRAPIDETPEPLFASTMRTLEAEARQRGDAGTNGASGHHSDPFEHVDDTADELGDLEFDIGEASRVVKLPILPPRRASNVAGVSRIESGHASAQRFGAGSGAHGSPPVQLSGAAPARYPSLGLGATQRPRARQRRYLVPVAAGGTLVAAVVGVLIYLGVSRNAAVSPAPVAHDMVSGENLGYSLGPEAAGKAAASPKQAAGTPSAPTAGGGAIRHRRRAGSSSRRRERSGVARSGTRSSRSGLFGSKSEVDLSADTNNRQLTPLSPDDLLDVYRARRFMIDHCYDQALKHDPLLNVHRARVTITIAASGKVSEVSIPTLRHTMLGNCLVARISAWRLRRSSGTFTGRITMVFSR